MDDPKPQFMFINGGLHFGPYGSFADAAQAATEYAERVYKYGPGFVDWTSWPTITIAAMVIPTKAPDAP
jgi:hypothetical protein